jgi:hypothetical protein
LLERLVKSADASAIDVGLLAVAYGEMGRAADATNRATVASTTGSNDFAALLLAGRAMLLAGHPSDAARLFEKALALHPGDREAAGRLEMARAAERGTRPQS